MSLESVGQSKRVPFMDWIPTPDEQKIISRIAQLARERFALRAARYDAELALDTRRHRKKND
jgi:hypothetical protein